MRVRRQKLTRWGWQILLVLSLFAIPAPIIWQWVRPDPNPVIGPQTTYIEQPINLLGRPDYQRWILQKYEQAMDPENNGVVELWPHLVAADFCISSPVELARFLRIPKQQQKSLKPRATDPFEKLEYQFNNWSIVLPGEYESPEFKRARKLLTDLNAALTTRAWSEADWPELASHLDPELLSAVKLAASHPDFLLPRLADHGTDGERELRLGDFPCRSFFQIVLNEAHYASMLHLGRGEYSIALDHAISVYRLIDRVRGSGTAFEMQKDARRDVARDLVVRVAEHVAEYDISLAKLALQTLENERDTKLTQMQLLELSRVEWLENVLQYGISEVRQAAQNRTVRTYDDVELSLSKLQSTSLAGSLDITPTLRMVNEYYDLCQSLIQADKQETLDQIAFQLDTMANESEQAIKDSRDTWLTLVFPSYRNELCKNIFFLSCVGSTEEIIRGKLRIRNEVKHRMSILAIEIALYRSSHKGRLPDSLSSLTDTPLSNASELNQWDAFITYDPAEKGYLLTAKVFPGSDQFVVQWKWSQAGPNVSESLGQLRALMDEDLLKDIE